MFIESLKSDPLVVAIDKAKTVQIEFNMTVNLTELLSSGHPAEQKSVIVSFPFLRGVCQNIYKKI